MDNAGNAYVTGYREGSFYATSYDYVTVKYSSGITDSDSDGVPDSSDNCLNTPNTSQEDSDGDGIDDHCDTDIDIKKTEVEWDKNKIKIHGEISLPVGKT